MFRKNNTFFATCNEILVGKNLVGSFDNFNDKEYVVNRFQEARDKFSKVEFEIIDNISTIMAEQVREYLNHHPLYNNIKRVNYSATGDHNDPSDIVCEFDDKNLGVSCKVMKAGFKAKFKNYSFSTLLDHISSEPAKNLFATYDKKIITHFGMDEMTASQRKDLIRSSKYIKDNMQFLNNIKLNMARDYIYDSFQFMENKNEYFLKNWLNIDLKNPYVKVIGNYNKMEAVLDDPFVKFKRNYYSNCDITFKKNNEYGIIVLFDEDPKFEIYFKNNSEMFSSIINCTTSPLGTFL